MTETTEPTEAPKTVQRYRHQIRDIVRGVVGERYSDAGLRRIANILEGRVGLSQAQQVERLDQSLEVLSTAADGIAEARTVGVEARDYAATRDFEAHQAAKAARGERGASSLPERDEDETVGDDA